MYSVTSLENIDGIEATDKDLHTGLVVYNVNSDCLEKDLYVWNGLRWINLSGQTKLSPLEMDSLALIALYHANPDSKIGINSSEADRWNLLEKMENWSGITISEDPTCRMRRVQKINLTTKDLSTIPPEIKDLDALTTLAIGGNLLTALPDELFELVQLEELRLGNNSILNLQSGIGNLVNLTKLVLSYNLLIEIPTSITNIPAYCAAPSYHADDETDMKIIPQDNRDPEGPGHIEFAPPSCN